MPSQRTLLLLALVFSCFALGRAGTAHALEPLLGAPANPAASSFSDPGIPQQTPFAPPAAAAPGHPMLHVQAPELFEPGQVLAFVGDQPILAGDVLPLVNQMLEPHLDEIPPQQLESQRRLLVEQLLEQMIQSKLLYLDFLRQVPPDKLPELRRKLYESYNENELEKAIQRAGVNNPAELDAKLRQYGSSLEKQQRSYMETVLSQEMLRQKSKLPAEVTHEEMLHYYYQHIVDYQIPAKARYEILSAHFDKFSGKAEAWQAIASWGDKHLLGQVPFAVVAKRYSHGFTAAQGGYNDWTTQGALASRVLDQAIFTLEVGELSHILEDEVGFHIIRVLERRPAGRVPFAEAQAQIKEAIGKERRKQAVTAYVAQLRDQTPVWTAFK